MAHRGMILGSRAMGIAAGLAAALPIAVLPQPAGAAPPDVRVVTAPGCNASAFAQIPGSPTLFIGRQLLTADGKLAPPEQAEDCSGGNPANEKKLGRSFNRWSLMLDRFDWTRNRFEVVKPLLDTTMDPETGLSLARITGGPMKGAIIKSAYDPSVASFGNVTYVAFECIIQNGGDYKVSGTSSCVGVYDPIAQRIDLSRTRVMVSGVVGKDSIWAAGIPHLLAYKNKLYMFWSAGYWKDGVVSNWRVRAAQLIPNPSGVAIKGADDRAVPATTPLAVDVWQRDPKDHMGGNILDLFATLQINKKLYIFYASGGDGCIAPSGKGPGCYHLSIAPVSSPLAPGALNRAVPENIDLPTNPVEYAIPVTDPAGQIVLMGHFIRPTANGFSEKKPMPDAGFWQGHRNGSVYALTPLPLK